MRQWGITQGCELCGERYETRDHLFFACSYSYTVWENLAQRLVDNNINLDWQWTVQRLQRMGGQGNRSLLGKTFVSDISLPYMEGEKRKEASTKQNFNGATDQSH